MRKLLLVMLLTWAASGMAESTLYEGKRNRAIPPQKYAPELDRSRLQINNQRAALLVRNRFSDRRILGLRLIKSKGPPIYKVKTLSDSGVVKFVFVDAGSGEVFE
jgi:hypothetical protein